MWAFLVPLAAIPAASGVHVTSAAQALGARLAVEERHEGKVRSYANASIVAQNWPTNLFVLDTDARSWDKFRLDGAYAVGKVSMQRLQQELSASWLRNQQLDLMRVIEVAVPGTRTLCAMFGFMAAPVVAGWCKYQRTREDALYFMLLPLTLCVLAVSQDISNQALAVLMDAPNAITAIQAVGITLITGVWAAIFDFKDLKAGEMWNLIPWTSVAVFFAVYQIINHLVSSWCSLSERVVITNLCPVLSLMFEVAFMPANLKATPSLGIVMSLAIMVLGAIVFGCFASTFSSRGLVVGASLALVVVPYRLTQRYMLNYCRTIPVSILACMDGLFLAVATLPVAASQQTDFLWSLKEWMSSATVFPALMLSLPICAGVHVCGLLLLRARSATSYLVFHNFANVLVVIIGILFFKDTALGKPTTAAGLMITLLGGLCYAYEASASNEGGGEQKKAAPSCEEGAPESSQSACDRFSTRLKNTSS